MKRDLNLVRQLLLDIENRGADCSVSVLREDSDGQREERIRYHLRLLLDACLLKEIDRTSAGIPCVRLSHQGHELLELVRDESVWREALWVCHDRTGSLSLTVIRDLLGSWAHRRARQPLEHRHRPYPIAGYRLESVGPPRYREELVSPYKPVYPIESYYPAAYREGPARDYPEVRYVPVRETTHAPRHLEQPWRPSSREHDGRFDLGGESCFRTAEENRAEPSYDSTLTDHIL